MFTIVANRVVLTCIQRPPAESAQVIGHLAWVIVGQIAAQQGRDVLMFQAICLRWGEVFEVLAHHEIQGIVEGAFGRGRVVVFDEDRLAELLELNETPVRGRAFGGFEGLGLFLSDADEDDAVADGMLVAQPAGDLVFTLAFLEPGFGLQEQAGH